MRVEKLFQVLVVAGASATVGLIGCGDDDEGGGGDGGDTETGGSSAEDGGTGGSSGGSGGKGGASSSGGKGGASAGGSGGSAGSGGAGKGGSGGKGSGGASSGGKGGASEMDSGTPDAAGDASGSMEAGDMCEEACMTNEENDNWIDCNGCCCWLPAGQTGAGSSPICDEDELCCIGRGRDED